MGADVTEPTEARKLHRAFIANPQRHAAIGPRTAVRTLHSSKEVPIVLCVASAADNTAGYRPNSTRGRSAQSRAVADALPLSDVRDQVKQAQISEWKLGRFVDQGPTYLYQVWRGGKSSVSTLIQEMEGIYHP